MEYGLTTAQIYQTIANEIKTDTSSTTLTVGRNDYPVIVSSGDSLTKNELNSDVKVILSAGADGYSLYRYKYCRPN